MKPTLIESFDDRDNAISACHYYAALLRALQLRNYGVSIRPIRGTSAFGVFVRAFTDNEPDNDARIRLTLASRTHSRARA